MRFVSISVDGGASRMVKMASKRRHGMEYVSMDELHADADIKDGRSASFVDGFAKAFGHLKKPHSVDEIADRHGTSTDDIDRRLKQGVKVETEHTENRETARVIALHHLWEMPNYYDLLEEAEKVGDGALKDDLPDGLCPFAYDAAKLFVKMTKDDWNYITPQDLEKRGLDKFFILDIRKPEDYKECHLKGATNIFWLDLFKADNLRRLPQDKTILVYCYVGHTSSQVLVLLKLLGFDAVGLKFGMGKSPVEGVPVAGWLDYGFETVKGSS